MQLSTDFPQDKFSMLKWQDWSNLENCIVCILYWYYKKVFQEDIDIFHLWPTDFEDIDKHCLMDWIISLTDRSRNISFESHNIRSLGMSYINLRYRVVFL